MQFEAFEYKVTVYVLMTGTELADLFRIGVNHYDAKCRMWTKKKIHTEMASLMCRVDPGNFPPEDTTPDGYAKLLREKYPEDTLSVDFTWSDLDTVNKILEMVQYVQNPPVALMLSFNRLFNNLRRRHDSINRFSPGTWVQTLAHDEWATRHFTDLTTRQWGVKGKIIVAHDFYGLSYEVEHPDGSIGHYAPEELREDINV